MKTSVLTTSAMLGLIYLPLLAGCGSSKRQNNDGPPNERPLAIQDAGLGLDADPSNKDTRDTSDARSTDGPPLPVDAPNTPLDTLAPSFDGNTRPDGNYTSSPDGRLFLLVDYCQPILPVPAYSGRECPATIDDAFVSTRVDAGRPGGTSPVVQRCAEKTLVHLPYGPYAGGGAVCYYDEASRAPIAIIIGWDTPSACSDQSDTASFISKVYGKLITCTDSTPIVIDAGSGQ